MLQAFEGWYRPPRNAELVRHMRNFIERFGAAALTLLALAHPGVAAEQRVSVAVLPFTNASRDADQEALADGFTEDVAATLAKIPALNVGARASAFRFKAPIRDRIAIGRALSKTHLLEGTFRTDSGRIRLLVRLIRAGDGEQLWYEDYDEPLAGIFNVEEAIAKAVAGALRAPLPAGCAM